MRVMAFWAVVFLLVSAGCATSERTGQGSAESAQPTATSSAAPPSAESASSASDSSATTSPESTPDLAVFIAAVDEAMEGTSYEDAALSDPEVFIGVGQLFCELLDEGESVDGVLAEYLDALVDENTGSVADDDAFAAGVLMGVSIEVLCPEHRPGA